jgi:hypothetical protein
MPPEISFSSFLTSCHFLLHIIIIFIISFSSFLFPHFLLSYLFLIILFPSSTYLTLIFSYDIQLSFPCSSVLSVSFFLSEYSPFFVNLFIYFIFPCPNFLFRLFPIMLVFCLLLSCRSLRRPNFLFSVSLSVL